MGVGERQRRLLGWAACAVIVAASGCASSRPPQPVAEAPVREARLAVQDRATPSIWPARHTPRVVTSSFGYRTDPITGQTRYHKGLDLRAPEGSPALATASGTVTISAYSPSYGHFVAIDHGNGYETRYAHLSRRMAEPGQAVRQGQSIGLVGGTGRVTAPHLHYEVRKDGELVNPRDFLPR